MTGNPNDCRLHAVEGWHEAEFARTAQARATLEQFAKLWLDLAAYEREHALLEKWGGAPCADQRDLPDRPKVTVGLIAAFQPARSSDAILRRDACISPSSYGQLVHHEINRSGSDPKCRAWPPQFGAACEISSAGISVRRQEDRVSPSAWY
jgi:hypothetical protein